MSVEKLGTNARIERLDVRILRRLSRLNEKQFDAVFLGPPLHDFRRQLGPVVNSDIFRITEFSRNVIENVDDALTGERVI